MESKQPSRNSLDAKPNIEAITETKISGQLADIELKLDHIIESIKDSLHRLNLEGGSVREESP